MAKTNKSNKAIWTVLITALASSSCCIAPIVSLIAGVGGLSSNLKWLNPLRPYLIALTVVVLIYVWVLYFKNQQKDDCGCVVEKRSFFNSKGFLIGMTVFAILSIAFPYFMPASSKNTNKVTLKDLQHIKTININIEGMTCTACENHVSESVLAVDGVVNVVTSYSLEQTTISYDSLQSDLTSIINAIKSTGYQLKNYE